MIGLRPGDLVTLASTFGSQYQSAISSMPGFLSNVNLHLGDLKPDQLAIVISQGSDEDRCVDETLILTSSGILGWISTESLGLVSDGFRARRQ